ncbi:hypothetical protein OsJ_10763 [Oryza sativa Japonica Group]|uniref:Expansin n=1 Tax=Oryza sativa subsp. japonica TaxID=39947 RepID=A3AHQ8_ORYSJ|nr:hypothetical protein OsJ_10763 [Oryza sativa Japonica Group]
MAPPLLLLLASLLLVAARRALGLGLGQWQPGHATFYGGGDASGTMGGALRGTGTLYSQGYGTSTAALSTALFNRGPELRLLLRAPVPGRPPPVVPPRRRHRDGDGDQLLPPELRAPERRRRLGNPPRRHFDLAEPAFLRIARHAAGIVPVSFRRVACARKGGVRFTVNGHAYFNLVLVTNVGGAGDVRSLAVKGRGSGSRVGGRWQPMSRNWGQNWQSNAYLDGKALSFRVTAGDGRSLTCADVAPAGWQFGQTFEGRQF